MLDSTKVAFFEVFYQCAQATDRGKRYEGTENWQDAYAKILKFRNSLS